MKIEKLTQSFGEVRFKDTYFSARWKEAEELFRGAKTSLVNPR